MIASLEPYLVRAILARREYNIANKALVMRAVGGLRSPSRSGAGVSANAFFDLWIALLWVVVDCWDSHLRCSDQTVEQLLESDFTPLLRRFRNSVFHFDPDAGYTPLRTAGEEDEVLVWLDSLTEALASFFLRELGEESLIQFVVSRATA